MQTIQTLLDQVASYHPSADLGLISRVYEFAATAHEGQRRKSGESYVTHPLAVASVIAELRLDVASICAGLLHDSVEDTAATLEQLTELFGKEIAFLVDGVTKLGKLPYSTREEQQAENFRKMLLAMARDIRVILVKLCDRLDNMRSLEHLAPEKQERIAAETMQIYAPLANRLGIQWVKVELEDFAFRYLYPGEFEQLSSEVAKTREEQDAHIAEIERLIAAEMRAHGVPCEVSGRAKHLWSTWQKMKRTGRAYGEINDAIGFRIITDDINHCYQALGVAHQAWTPIPGRFKDYIALPKPNLYQSLHTAVIAPSGERIEIQIRTQDMHQAAEAGIAAHWKYKEGSHGPATDDQKFAWLRQMMEAHTELRDPTEFLESVKLDLFGDEVFVFTPNGDVKSLPKGACPVDFAYAIHSNIGDRCSGARVNGMLVPLRYQLRNGDTVEIITSPTQRPNKDWLKIVKTAKARTKIRYLLRQDQRDRALSLGEELLEKALRKEDASMGKLQRSGELEEIAKHFRCADINEMVLQIGYGKVTPAGVVAVWKERTANGTSKPVSIAARGEALVQNLIRKVTRRQSGSGVLVAGSADVLVRFAKCCTPLPGDQIAGFITRGRGVTVHRRECTQALDIDPERRIDVAWDGTSNVQHEVGIQVLCADKPGLLAHISQCFSDQAVNISQAHCRTMEDGRAVNTFNAGVKDLEQLKAVIRALSRIKGVYSVDRVASSE